MTIQAQISNTPMLMHIEAYEALVSAFDKGFAEPALRIAGRDSHDIETFCHLSVFGPTLHRLPWRWSQVCTYRAIRQELEELKQDVNIPAIFIEFDGPGGEAAGCFDLVEWIADLATHKPVIGFINGYCLSANYALASACTQLYASAHSQGGSIGAIYGRRELRFDEMTMTYFSTGEAKADGAPLNAMTEAEKNRHQTSVDETGEQFFSLVAKNRNLKVNDIKALEANIFNAQQLLTHGLIDGIKTEQEIKTMMTNARHNKIVAGMEASHAEEKAQLTTQLTELQQQIQQQGETHQLTIKKINQLASAAGVPEMAGSLIENSTSETDATKAIKEAAAKKDEELSLTGTNESLLSQDTDENYDMQQLIKDA